VTGLLKDLMHDRADHLAPRAIDLEAITRNGERRIRRRRIVGGASALTAAVALTALAPVVFEGGSDGDDRNRIAVSEAASLTWAEGEVIHVGEQAYDIGHDVHAFVATSDGYVVVDPDGAVWSWTGGPAERVGTTRDDGSAVLVSDGGWAGWIGSDSQEYVFLNQSTGTLQRAPVSTRVGESDEDRLLAIDGTTAYVSDQRGVVTIDLDSGEAVVIGPWKPGSEIADVEGGLILHTFRGDDGEDLTVASRELAKKEPTLGVRGGDLSPSGRYVMSENSSTDSDRFTLLQLSDGREVTPAVAREYDFFLGYAWSDDNTYSAFGMGGLGGSNESAVTLDLLTCEVDTRSCRVAEDHPKSFRDFEIPVGMHIGD